MRIVIIMALFDIAIIHFQVDVNGCVGHYFYGLRNWAHHHLVNVVLLCYALLCE